MSYEIILAPSARKDLDRFHGTLLAKFEKLILGLAANTRPLHSRKLRGGEEAWRLRTGDYRILYEIDDSRKEVRIFRIAHRKEAYR